MVLLTKTKETDMYARGLLTVGKGKNLPQTFTRLLGANLYPGGYPFIEVYVKRLKEKTSNL